MMEAFMEHMLGPNDVPIKVYFVNNSTDCFRMSGYIIAPRNAFELNVYSVDDFYESIRHHGFDTGVPTPWIPVFVDKQDAETYAIKCGAKYSIHGVDSSEWYPTGVVVVNAPKVKRVGAPKLPSELLVHLKFPLESVIDGLEKEKQKWRKIKEQEKYREAAEMKQKKKAERHKKRATSKTPSTASGVSDKSRKDMQSTLTQNPSSNDQGLASTSKDKIKDILADEMRIFGQKSWLRGYLVDWESSEGITWMPSWVSSKDIDKAEVAKYQAQKSWSEFFEKKEEQSRILGLQIVDEILYHEPVKPTAQRPATVRYLVKWEGNIPHSWLFEDEFRYKSLIMMYRDKIKKWKVYTGDGME